MINENRTQLEIEKNTRKIYKKEKKTKKKIKELEENNKN